MDMQRFEVYLKRRGMEGGGTEVLAHNAHHAFYEGAHAMFVHDFNDLEEVRITPLAPPSRRVWLWDGDGITAFVVEEHLEDARRVLIDYLDWLRDEGEISPAQYGVYSSAAMFLAPKPRRYTGDKPDSKVELFY